jgi:hypothetical protein
MSTATTEVQFNLRLTGEERDELIRLLDTALGEVRTEVHRTHTPAYRDQVLEEEGTIRSLLGKLKEMNA